MDHFLGEKKTIEFEPINWNRCWGWRYKRWRRHGSLMLRAEEATSYVAWGQSRHIMGKIALFDLCAMLAVTMFSHCANRFTKLWTNHQRKRTYGMEETFTTFLGSYWPVASSLGSWVVWPIWPYNLDAIPSTMHTNFCATHIQTVPTAWRGWVAPASSNCG